MKILFVNGVNYLEAVPPEGIALLSAVLKGKGHEVKLFDTCFLKPAEPDVRPNKGRRRTIGVQFHVPTAYSLEDLVRRDKEVDIAERFNSVINSFEPDLIAVSSMTSNFYKSIKLLSQVKKKIKVVFGGVHPTLMPDEVINEEYVDFVCVGEGEGALLDLCDRLEKGVSVDQIRNLYVKTKHRIIKNPLRPFVDLNDLPAPDLSLFDKRHFFRPFLGRIYKGVFLSTSRGCPRGCHYCVNNRLKDILKSCGKRYVRFQEPRIVARNIKLLKEQYGITWFKFSDDTFLLRPLRELEDLKDLIKPLNIMFGCSVDPATITEEKVALAKEMGCVAMSIGVETGNEALRKTILGRNISNDTVIKAIGIANAYGIKVSTFNMIGLPGETKDNVFETLRLNKRLNVSDANLYIIFPFPGTEISHRYKIPLDKCTLPMSEAYKFGLSEVSPSDLLFFQKAFNVFLLLPEEEWAGVYESKKNNLVYEGYVRAAQKLVSVSTSVLHTPDVGMGEFIN